jgi:hypothetical protein
LCKVFQRKDLRPDFPVQVWLKSEARLVGRAFSFSYYFYFNEWSETKMPSLVDLFLARKGFDLFGFPIFIFTFGGFEGLTCDFWAKSEEKMNATAKADPLQAVKGL